MAAVLVHIDLDGDRPHPASLAALAAGRAIATSWGAVLYAAVVAPGDAGETDFELPRAALARGGADKIVVARTDAPIAPLWAVIGSAWQTVLDHLRPRLALFGAEAPSAAELGPRTGARIGARLLVRSRPIGAGGTDELELRDRDGASARAADGGATVALIAGAITDAPAAALDEDDIDVMVLDATGGADARVELLGTSRAPAAVSTGALIAIDPAADASIAKHAQRLAALLGAQVVGGELARGSPIAPELCISVGAPRLDIAGAAAVVKIGAPGVEGELGDADRGLAALVRALGGD